MGNDTRPSGVAPESQFADALLDTQARISRLREHTARSLAAARRPLADKHGATEQLRRELRATAGTAGITTPAIARLCANVDSRLGALVQQVLEPLTQLQADLATQLETIQCELGAAQDHYHEVAGRPRRVRHNRKKQGEGE